jgi:hypothetical protein
LIALGLLAVAIPARAGSTTCPADTGDPVAAERKGRELFEEALRREAADPRGALEILTCVQRLADKPAVSLRVGIIAERLGNTKLAADSFERYLALAGDAAPDRREMREHIDHLRAEIAKAKKPAPAPPPAPPPETGPAPPTPEQPPSEPATRSPLPGWVVVGTGGVLMVVGGLFLIDAKKKNDDVHAIEPGTTYWNSAEAKDRLDQASREQTIGYVALGIGAAAASVGVWLVLDANRHVAATARVTPDSARATVRVAF